MPYASTIVLRLRLPFLHEYYYYFHCTDWVRQWMPTHPRAHATHCYKFIIAQPNIRRAHLSKKHALAILATLIGKNALWSHLGPSNTKFAILRSLAPELESLSRAYFDQSILRTYCETIRWMIPRQCVMYWWRVSTAIICVNGQCECRTYEKIPNLSLIARICCQWTVALWLTAATHIPIHIRLVRQRW